MVVAGPTHPGDGLATFESDLPFRQLFAVSPDAMILIDPDDPNVSWPIVDCNEAACRMNGYTREELIGTSIDIFNVSDGTREEREEYFARLRREGNILLETFHRHKDGHAFPIEVSTSLVTLGGKEFVLGIDRDITERRRAEDALQRAIDAERLSVERLRELDQMKNTFLTAVSHDLRTPLAAVLGSALTLQRLRATLTDEEQVQLIDAVASNADRLKRMLEDLLDLGRLTRGVLEPVRSPTDLRGAGPQAGRRLGRDGRARRPHRRRLLGRERGCVEGRTDRRQPPGERRQAHAAGDGDLGVGAVGRRRCAHRRRGRGGGISKEGQEHIFEPFQQLDPRASTRRAWGSAWRSWRSSPSSTADARGCRIVRAAAPRSASSSRPSSVGIIERMSGGTP